jgi:3-oxosteroid 1-dehydrogenase
VASSSAVIIVGAGLGGMAAAITAAEAGLAVTVIEKGARVGGTTSHSAGQVWVGANHVARRHGIEDNADDVLAYVSGAASARGRPDSIDTALAREWIDAATVATEYFEQLGVIRWEPIEGYPDYYHPDVAGSRPEGRYITGVMFDGASLGAERALLDVSPLFTMGLTYRELFAWGGLFSKTRWDWETIRSRQARDQLTFGPSVTGPFFKAMLDRGVTLHLEADVVELVSRDGSVVGARFRTRDGELSEAAGPVILACGAHDWSEEGRRYSAIPTADGGSAAPGTVSGDAMTLARGCGAAVSALPPWAPAILPGYRLPEPAFPGDTGFRGCYEHCLPNTFLVDASGRRFCDDSFHPAIAMALDDPDLFPIHMVWDDRHHRTYGLGATMPGAEYPAGLVTTADTLTQLAAKVGLPERSLAETAERFNEGARHGEDPDFGRGTNLSVRRFRGDLGHQPNPCVGPVEDPPFHAMRVRVLNTGIAAAGVVTASHGAVVEETGDVIPGLYAVGECALRSATGVGYNSGFSLGRAMAFGYLAARHVSQAG